MIRSDKFTVKAHKALQAAQELGERSGQQQIEPLHVLWALVAEGDGAERPLREGLGGAPPLITSGAEKQIARLPKGSGVSERPFRPATTKVVDRAVDEAQRLKD